MGGGAAGGVGAETARDAAGEGHGGGPVPSPEMLAAGYERLELALLAAATASLVGGPGDGAAVSAETAVKLLNLRRSSLAATVPEGVPQLDAERMRDVIATRVKAVRRARKPRTKGPEQAAPRS